MNGNPFTITDEPRVFVCPCGGYRAESLTESRHAERIATHRAHCPANQRRAA